MRENDADFSCPEVWEHFLLSLLFPPHPEALEQTVDLIQNTAKQTCPLFQREMGGNPYVDVGKHCRNILGIFLRIFQSADHDLFVGNEINLVGCFQHVF